MLSAIPFWIFTFLALNPEIAICSILKVRE
jgi:hypothetical protein